MWFQMVKFRVLVVLLWLPSGARIFSRTASISSSKSLSKCLTLEYLSGEERLGQVGKEPPQKECMESGVFLHPSKLRTCHQGRAW